MSKLNPCECDSISSGICYCNPMETYKVKLSSHTTNDYCRKYTGKPNTEKDVALEYIEWCWLNLGGWEWMAEDIGVVQIVVNTASTGKDTIFDYDIECEPSFYVKQIKTKD